MLVLSRKKGEQIRIGDDIVITIHRVTGNRVSIGIEAPANLRIVRGELQAIVEQFQEPAAAAPAPRKLTRSRPTPNIAAETNGENRIAAHLPAGMRS